MVAFSGFCDRVWYRVFTGRYYPTTALEEWKRFRKEQEKAHFIGSFRKRRLHKMADDLEIMLEESWEDMVKRCEESRNRAQEDRKDVGDG